MTLLDDRTKYAKLHFMRSVHTVAGTRQLNIQEEKTLMRTVEDSKKDPFQINLVKVLPRLPNLVGELEQRRSCLHEHTPVVCTRVRRGVSTSSSCSMTAGLI